jgi:hypothetical protein
MSQDRSESNSSDEFRALALLEQALAILDAIDAPGDIGAHVDLAISRLRDELGMEPLPPPDVPSGPSS